MTKFQVTMVNPQQIAQKGLKGCKTTRQVTTFAQKHNVPWTWYKPTPNYRVMLVDWPGFRTAWKENATFGTKIPTTGTSVKTGTWSTKTTPRPAIKTRTAGIQKTTYATARGTAPKASFKTANPKSATKTFYSRAGKTSYRTNTISQRTKRAA
jgi:hypothetical protein